MNLAIVTEAERHAAFERCCGGPVLAFRLMRIGTSARQAVSGNRFTTQKRPGYEEVFRNMAKAAGYTDAQAQAYLDL